MNRPPYEFRLANPAMSIAEPVIADNGSNIPLHNPTRVTHEQYLMSGVFSPNNSFSTIPVFGTNQHGVQQPSVDGMPPHSLVSSQQIHPGPGVGFTPPGQKYSSPPPLPPPASPGQALLSSQPSRSGDSTPQRATPQPYGPYPATLQGSYGQTMPASNGLSANIPASGSFPGDGLNRSSLAPPASLKMNGPPPHLPPQSVVPGASPSFGPRSSVLGTAVQQQSYMVTPPGQPSQAVRPRMFDNQPAGTMSVSPYPGPPPMNMPYRGTVPLGPPAIGAAPLSTAPPGIPQTTPATGMPFRGPHQLSSAGTPPLAMMPPGPPPIGARLPPISTGPPPFSTLPTPIGTAVRGAIAPPPPPMMPVAGMSTLGKPSVGPPPVGGVATRGPFPMAASSVVRGSQSESLMPSGGHHSLSSSVGNSASDSASESPSQQSSRTGSPTNQLNYDDMEGQFVSSYPGTGSYSSPIASGNRPVMPPTSFPSPPNQYGPTHGQSVNSFLPQQQPSHQMQTFASNNYTGSLNASLNRLHLQPDHSMPLNLLQERHILPSTKVELAEANLPGDLKKVNCSSDIMACTINAIPNTQSLLNKSRLPLGVLIHPFKDLSLPVIQSSVIVRCRSCRTYINPFISFVDAKRWKCNLCYRVNELPDDFSYDPVSKTYGEPQRRPEIRSATIEFVAPSEYMLRPPQPAVYMYLLDVSFNAIETGYLQVFCQTLIDELERIPGDSRLQIGFITYDTSLHFYNLAEELSQPHMYVVSDLEEVELPSPDSLLVNLQESKGLVIDLLNKLPLWFEKNMETGSALGPALQAAFKMMSPTGGRVTVVQTHLPTVGAGALKSREDPNERAGKNVQNLGPVTDFYKKLALDCSAQQIAVDLFMVNSQYADIATLAGVSKYSGGCLYVFPGFHTFKNLAETKRFVSTLRRYITRKIGFEAVMRIRCTRGLSIHTFHGNFFVRSTDLLSLPNVNPDAGYGVQMSIDETLESNYVCFQAALLYTSSKGERRIRVHTLCLPVTSSLGEVQSSANQLAIIGLLAKMAVDKSLSACLSDAREAMINAVVDMLSAYGSSLSAGQRLGQLPCPYQLRLVPMYVLAMLKSSAFRVGTSTKLDDRVFAMEQCKNLPLRYLLQMFHPDLYPVHSLDEKNAIYKDDKVIVQPSILPLSSAHIDRHGAYLMDMGSHMYLWLGASISDQFCHDVFGVSSFQSVTDGQTDISELDNPTSQALHHFVQYLNEQRPFSAPLIVLREDSRSRSVFLQHLIEDRTESTLSYVEFLQHIQKEIKS